MENEREREEGLGGIALEGPPPPLFKLSMIIILLQSRSYKMTVFYLLVNPHFDQSIIYKMV